MPVRKFSIIALLTVLCGLVNSSFASIIGYNFIHEGFDEGATATGMFFGEDLNMDGQLSSANGEVTDFMMSFSGNSLVGAFTADFNDLFGLVYDLGFGPELGDGLTIDAEEGIGVIASSVAYGAGAGPLGGATGGLIEDVLGQVTSSTQNPIVSLKPIPEPTALLTWTLLGLTVGFVRRYRRK